MIQAKFQADFDGWRAKARELMQARAKPENILWNEEGENLSFFASDEENHNSEKWELTVPKEFMQLAKYVSCARDPDRWSLLYRILYRLQFEDKNLLKIVIDPDVHKAQLLVKSIRRDIHKMHAFVRFKKKSEQEEIYVAWHRPEHLILKLGAPFFVRRFGDKPWIIYTPDESAAWDGKELKYFEGIEQHQFETKDAFDEIWKTYYSSIFNPARIKVKMMKAEMPTKYWQSLPEVALISEMIRQSPERLQKMAKNQTTHAQIPPVKTWQELEKAAHGCRACPLAQKAHHLVFGKGPSPCDLMIVGEQPGDEEDKTGEAFVGPAGQVLNEQLKEALLKREYIYITNAVKHFKWIERETPRGKMRLHQKPTGREMHACKPWLEKEIEFVKPKLIVALGATAATAILGRLPKISEERGKFIEMQNHHVLISWHPSAILRSMNEEEAHHKKRELLSDLKLARQFVKQKK